MGMKAENLQSVENAKRVMVRLVGWLVVGVLRQYP